MVVCHGQRDGPNGSGHPCLPGSGSTNGDRFSRHRRRYLRPDLDGGAIPDKAASVAGMAINSVNIRPGSKMHGSSPEHTPTRMAISIFLPPAKAYWPCQTIRPPSSLPRMVSRFGDTISCPCPPEISAWDWSKEASDWGVCIRANSQAFVAWARKKGWN